MTDQNESLREDIAFLRTMAEAGRDRPMVGASILIMSGLVFGVAAVLIWALSQFLQVSGPWVPSAVMFPAMAIYAVGLFVLLRRLPKSAGAMQEATGVAWSSIGWGMSVLFIVLWVAAYRLGRPDMMFVFPSILLTLYGSTWIIAAFLLRQRWLHAVGIGSFAMAAASAWVVGQPVMWLVFGLSLLGLLAAPGFVLMRQAQKAGGHG